MCRVSHVRPSYLLRQSKCAFVPRSLAKMRICSAVFPPQICLICSADRPASVGFGEELGFHLLRRQAGFGEELGFQGGSETRICSAILGLLKNPPRGGRQKVGSVDGSLKRQIQVVFCHKSCHPRAPPPPRPPGIKDCVQNGTRSGCFRFVLEVPVDSGGARGNSFFIAR